MERRKNREITAPPTELSFEDDRYESRDFGYGGGGRFRRSEPAAAAPAPSEPAAVAEETGGEGTT